ncbi:MAG TPA: hypothetical protein VIM84_00535 [Gemmatimonadales bacterium]
MLSIGQTVTDQDLARALRGERGTYLAQQSGQNYLVVAEEGHSIASIRPVGIAGERPATTARVGLTEPWFITKLSDDTGKFSERGRQGQREREYANQ